MNSFGARRGESLRVGVGDHEGDARKASCDHVVDRVASSAAYAAHHDVWLQFLQLGGVQINRHSLSLSLGVRLCGSMGGLTRNPSQESDLRTCSGLVSSFVARPASVQLGSAARGTRSV